jgi:hypothetical protein
MQRGVALVGSGFRAAVAAAGKGDGLTRMDWIVPILPTRKQTNLHSVDRREG